jgi:ribosomal protein L13E
VTAYKIKSIIHAVAAGSPIFYTFIVVAYNNNVIKMRINKPIIKRKIRGVKFIRNGRGFSKAELNEIGIINISTAKNKGLPIDLVRKTKNPENVEQLKPIAKGILNLRKTAGKKKG